MYADQRRGRGTTGQAAVILTTVVALAIGPLPGTPVEAYDVPAARRIVWNAGLDPEGGIPTYPVRKNAVSDYGADSTGTNDATSAIQTCVNGIAKPGACLLPAGTYRVNGTINMPAQAVLRGAGPGVTTLNMAAGASISFRGGSDSDMSAAIGITGGYTKDSTTLTLSSVSGLAVNDWISIFQNNDPSLIDASKCDWCGEDTDNAAHIMAQFARISAISGNVVTINRPMYFTYNASLSPAIKRVRLDVFKSGLESMTLNRTQSPTSSFVRSTFSRHCWLKNVEMNRGGNNTGEQHVRLEFSHGWEVRDSYLHHGYGYGSGSNYGVHIIFWNSDHKIENTIFFSLRHGVNFEGGGAGSVVLYNYFDAHQESEDPSFLNADLNPSHGSHPMMVLLEGNSSAKITWDETLGSSSHQTAFRNHARGSRLTPGISWGRWGIDVQARNRFMNIVGNVVGLPSWTSGTALANGSCSPSEPVAFRFGCDGQPGQYTDSQSRTTAVLHGNYDYITDGVAAWDGGSDHTLRASMYYSAKPAFFGACAWPAFGPDLNPIVGTLPAKARYEGSPACGQGQLPAAPSNLLIK